MFSRNGRIVDVQPRTPWTTFINNDRYIRVEVEFSAALDEAFGITTSKQQVSLSPEMWDHLRVAGLPKAIEHLRSKVRAAKSERQRATSESAINAGEHDTAPRGAVAAGMSAIIANSAKSQALEWEKLATLVRDSTDALDHSLALSTLLARINRRASDGDPFVIVEYQRLLRVSVLIKPLFGPTSGLL